MAIQNPTVNYAWVLPTVGGSADAWGTMLNTIFGDDAVGLDAVIKALETASKIATHVTSGIFDLARIPELPTSKIASGSGTPAEVSITAHTPPSMMNSPCAKLITPLAL